MPNYVIADMKCLLALHNRVFRQTTTSSTQEGDHGMTDQKSTKKTSRSSTDKKVDEALNRGFARLARITPMGMEQPFPISRPDQSPSSTLPPEQEAELRQDRSHLKRLEDSLK